MGGHWCGAAAGYRSRCRRPSAASPRPARILDKPVRTGRHWCENGKIRGAQEIEFEGKKRWRVYVAALDEEPAP